MNKDEIKLAKTIVADLWELGPVTIFHDGEDKETPERLEDAYDALGASDMTVVHVTMPDGANRYVILVWGQGRDCLVADWTMNLDSLISKHVAED